MSFDANCEVGKCAMSRGCIISLPYYNAPVHQDPTNALVSTSHISYLPEKLRLKRETADLGHLHLTRWHDEESRSIHG